MSEDQNRDYSKYDAMTTEELEGILRLDASAPEGENSDTELLLCVMGVLADRRKDHVTGKTAQESWESFQQNYLAEEEACPEDQQEAPGSRRSGPWLRRLIAVAAVAALLVCIPVTARAFGWGELWEVFARWTKETFSFVSGEDTQISEPSPDDRVTYASLQELLYKNNRDPNLVPTWIPEGYALVRIEKDITPMQEVYRAFYQDGQKELTIRVRSYLQKAPERIEISEETLEIYEVSGIEYYIFSNMDQVQVMWIMDSYQCTISGDLSLEEIKQMIDSIGKG